MTSTGGMSDETLVAYLQLARTKSVGPVTFQHLIGLFGNPHAALGALPDLSRSGGRRTTLKPFARRHAMAEIEKTRSLNGDYLVWGEANYPAMLAEIPDAPPVLGAHGAQHLLLRPTIAIVGARNASAAGKKLTQMLAGGLSQRDFVIVSGLARGIDRHAHLGALDGGTIACLGNGCDHFYPHENRDLQMQIMQQGLILCENPPDTGPQASLFPRRNRIISGLSHGTIIVEAARRSGSLITARLAGEQSREVMAVPGSPLDARCHGSNNLIREGAYLVESADDVIDIIIPLLDRQTMQTRPALELRARAKPPSASAAMRRAIIDLLSPVPISIDELVTASEESVALVHLILLELDLADRLTREPGGKYSLLDTM